MHYALEERALVALIEKLDVSLAIADDQIHMHKLIWTDIIDYLIEFTSIKNAEFIAEDAIDHDASREMVLHHIHKYNMQHEHEPG